jgi:hypothetical protein
VPGSHVVVGTFAKDNGPPRGSIAFIDPHLGKNEPRAITNLEHPDQPTFDLGNSCEPWPLSENVVLFSGRPAGAARNAIEIMDRSGSREVVLSDPKICLHSPMLVKPRHPPPALAEMADRQQATGKFFVQDIYQGLSGVKRGEVRWLRVIEETSRVSGSPGSPNPCNQTFLVSAALAFSAKNYLGVVPVDETGSAYFQAPAGRALYFQALDGEGRLIQSMRSFVQAAPGTTRSCIGCHEHKSSAVPNPTALPLHERPPHPSFGHPLPLRRGEGTGEGRFRASMREIVRGNLSRRGTNGGRTRNNHRLVRTDSPCRRIALRAVCSRKAGATVQSISQAAFSRFLIGAA